MPKAMLDKLPAKAKEIYESAWTDAKAKDMDDSQAAAYAIGAVKNAGFQKNETTGQWAKMTEPMYMVFGEAVTGGPWVEVACTGQVVDMNGRRVSISDNDLDRWVEAFQEDERGQEIPITYDHPKSGGKAAGWMRDLMKGPTRKIRGALRSTLLMRPEWTPNGKKSIDDGDYKYFSVEILPDNLLRAVSLVNFPAVKGLKPATAPAQLGEYYLQEFLLAEALEKCKECGAPIPEGSKACQNCGATLEYKEMHMSEENTGDPNVVALADFTALQERLEQLTEKSTEREEQLTTFAEAKATAEAEVVKMAEEVAVQSRQIAGLVEVNNMLRLHEKVTDWMQLSDKPQVRIAPAYEEAVINTLLLAEDVTKEQEILDLMGALARGDATVQFGELGSGETPLPRPDGEDVDNSRLHEKVMALSEKREISYKEALMEISREGGN